jgi:hypothetical protein
MVIYVFPATANPAFELPLNRSHATGASVEFYPKD